MANVQTPGPPSSSTKRNVPRLLWSIANGFLTTCGSWRAAPIYFLLRRPVKKN